MIQRGGTPRCLAFALACAPFAPAAEPATAVPADTVGRVDLNGPGVRHMAGPAQGLVGTPLDSSRVRKRLETVVDSAIARGFLTASVRAEEAIRTDSGVALRVFADAGSRSVWGQVRDRGGASLTPTALERIASLPRGAPAAPADLEKALRRLARTGYVESSAPPRLQRVPRTALVDGLVWLRDVPSSFVEAAATWERRGGTTGFVEAQLSNLYGTARDLGFGISQGDQGTRAHARYKEPWIGPWPVRLELSGSLANDSLSQALEGAAELVWPLWDGLLDVGAGVSGARRAERLPNDTLFGPSNREFGTRLSVSGRRMPPRSWPVGDVAGNLSIEASAISSDTGSGARVRVRTGIDGWAPVGPLALRLGAQGRGIWPLDRSAGLSEALAPGGIEGWRGWPEGSPRSPSWAWLVAQAGIGSPGSGGVFGFWEPGVRALRRQDRSWDPSWGWSAGVGFSGTLPAWQIDLAVSVRDDTPTWQDALLQVRARNRF